MGRPRKGPWRRAQNRHWYTTLDKKIVKVADKRATYDEAFSKFAERLTAPEVESTNITVAALLDDHLRWVQSNRSEATYEWYKRFALTFVEHIGKRLKVVELKPFHIQNWICSRYKNSTSTTKHGLIRAISRPLNWGLKNGLIDRNPILGIEKPTRRPRETVLTEKQYKEMVRYAGDQGFCDYLNFMWETGCRPQEIRIIEYRHRDIERVILEASNSKGERYNRVIYLNDVAGGIFDRLQSRTGPIFRNSNGNPWTANSVRCRFRKLKIRMGMPKLCANTLRHSWATNALKNGMDSTTASILMGHRDPSTLIRNYQHLAKDRKYLANASKEARKGA